ncbi:hypothetical protein GEMRC1_004285 [Eukaryota sp. GEM-RC1]
MAANLFTEQYTGLVAELFTLSQSLTPSLFQSRLDNSVSKFCSSEKQIRDLRSHLNNVGLNLQSFPDSLDDCSDTKEDLSRANQCLSGILSMFDS